MTAASIWMRLRSGEHLDLLHPDPQEWTDADLAYRLSRTYRWSGDSSWERPLSVAQHSLLVLAIRGGASQTPLSRTERLRELLHDAEEGLLGFDPLSPLKSHLGAALGSIVAPLTAAITLRYGLPCWDDATHHAHKWADRTAAASEAKHIVGSSDADVRDRLDIAEAPLRRDPLLRPSGYAAWEPWPASLAAELFLSKLGELLDPAIPTLLLPEADKPMHVLVIGGCEEIEGVVVRGDRHGEGRWDLDGMFTIRTDTGALFNVKGWTCSTETLP